MTKGAPEVLFVCEHNAARSQMAAALLHEKPWGRVLVRSAGSEPASKLNPRVVEAMSESESTSAERGAERTTSVETLDASK